MSPAEQTYTVNSTRWTFDELRTIHGWVTRYSANPCAQCLFDVGASQPGVAYSLDDVIAHAESKHGHTLTMAQAKNGLAVFSRWIKAELHKPNVPIPGIQKSGHRASCGHSRLVHDDLVADG
jgi:hypothetical protein